MPPQPLNAKRTVAASPLGSREEDRRGVAQPDVAEGDAVEPHAVSRGADRERAPRDALLLFVGDQDFGVLALGDRRDEARERGARGREVLLPEVGVAGPRDPGRLVRGPLGGHSKALFAGTHLDRAV